MPRPVHNTELGEYFAGLRPKGWTPSSAARYATQRQIRGLTRNILFRLENGLVKHYDPNVLRAVAELYQVPYVDIAARVVGAIYGGDLFRHAGTGQQIPHQGGADVPASADLRQEIDDVRQERDTYKRDLEALRAQWSQVQDVARRLFSIAVGDKDGAARRAAARRGRSARKAG